MISIAWAVIGRRAEDRHTDWLTRLWLALQTWNRRSRARQQLGEIDARTLRDAGIDPVAAQYESLRPFWVVERRLRDR